MNGVYRGGAFTLTANTWNYRNGGVRWATSALKSNNTNRGFRLNGVIRGGAYSHVSLRNTVFRRNGSYPQEHSYVSIAVGFRVGV